MNTGFTPTRSPERRVCRGSRHTRLTTHSASGLVAVVAARARLVDLTLAEPAMEDIIRRIYESPSVPTGLELL
jgi:ABC-type uncharacterized transport system ATPase subunit